LMRAKGPARVLAWLWLILSLALALYVPAMALVVIIGLIAFWRPLTVATRTIPVAWMVLGILLALILLAPLGWAIAKDWTVVKPLIPIPASWPAPLAAIKNSAWAGLALVWRAPQPSYLLFSGCLLLLETVPQALTSP